MTALVVLHAGPHKTGTTALQRALAANTDLLARNDVLYPQAGRLAESHSILGTALLRGDLSLLPVIAAEARPYRVALISTEHLSDVSPAGLAALRDAFPGATFRVAYSLRRLAGLWPSHWAELVKHGQSLSFAGYLKRVAERDDRPFFAPILPLRQLDRLASVFGIASLHISVYDQRLAEGTDLGPAFVDDLLGLGDIAPAFATTRSNNSSSSVRTAMAYLLNLHAGPDASYQIKHQARISLRDSLHQEKQPPWLSPLTEATGAAGSYSFGSDHPLVSAEQDRVAARYGPLLLDGVESYLAPLQSLVLDVQGLRLSTSASAVLTDAFEAALAEARRSGAPG